MKLSISVAAGTCLATLVLASCGGSDPGSETAPTSSARTLTAEQYYDKVHGGWLGSAIGGSFGANFQRMNKNDIELFLTESEQWPLTDYVKTAPPWVPPGMGGMGGMGVPVAPPTAYTGNEWGPAGFGPDDDILFQVANLLLLEEKGLDITSQDVADNWLAKFSTHEATNTGGAVRIAEDLLKQGVRPPESGQHERGEMMGGQMKGEFWGYLLPGNPEAAAEYGRIDAEVAFFGDGINGEMFMAAVTAEAFFESDAVIALALLYGDGDFDKAISIATMAGWDTDTNTADVAPVMGIILGASAIDEKWTAPIANIMRTDVRGAEELQIDELARRTVEIGMMMTAAKSAGRVEITD